LHRNALSSDSSPAVRSEKISQDLKSPVVDFSANFEISGTIPTRSTFLRNGNWPILSFKVDPNLTQNHPA
jgi:hypothetical protein